MSDYLLNYWNLFHDFASQFRGIVYRQLPLPLLANFYRYLSDPLKARMCRKDFYPSGALSIRRREDLFPAFNRLFGAAARKPRTGLHGRVLVQVNFVRLIAEQYSELFVRGETLLLGKGGPPTLFGHPLLNLMDYATDVSGAVMQLRRRAKEVNRTATFPVPDLTRDLADHLLQDLPRMAETVEAVRRLLDAYPVSCIVVGTTEDLLSRVLVMSAAIRGIPSICLQHGLIMGEEAYFPVFATRMAVYGRSELGWYLQRGVPRERIAVTGHPRHDLLRTRCPANRNFVLGGEGLDPGRKTVLLATQPGGVDLWLPFIRRLAGRYGLQVLIKPHPLEIGRGMAGDYAKALQGLSGTAVITRHVDLTDYLAAVDAVAVQSSTVGLEALLCGKPLFVLRGRLPDRDYDYYDRLGTFVKEDPVKLANLAYYVIGCGRLQAHTAETRRQFLHTAYPVALALPALAKQISLLTGTLAGSLQCAFDGQLVKGHRDEVYVIEGGWKRHIAGLSVFAEAGYRWEDVCDVDDRILDRIPNGPPIVRAGKRTGKREVRERLAGRLNGFLVQGSGHAVYLLERGLKRHIATEQTFARMRFNWENVCRLDDRILCSIPSGTFIG